MSFDIRDLFLLRKDITFLNFGSFGACPKPIFEDYQKWQYELEQEPVQFITVNGLRYLEKSREALASFLNCGAKDLVYVTNPSYAVNTIAKSLNLQQGDEVLTTNLEYGACDKAWNYYCKKTGAKYVQQSISLPLTSKEKFVEEFFSGFTSRTKLVFISHITSSTALIFPVKEIVAEAKRRGVMVFVDGAHAPAHVDLDLTALNADIYTGACHKWMMTPKGSSFLYVRKELQEKFDPLVVSWGYEAFFPSDSKFLDWHQMNGTRDYSAFLTIPKAIEFMNQYQWKEVSDRCKKLVRDNALRFCDLAGSQPLCPISDEFLGQLFSIPINTKEPEKLQRHLFEHYKIEIPVMRHGDKVYLRYSINAFNSQHDLDVLYNAISELIQQNSLISKF
ncbi:MAG TPA: aminotransferase class V-fold PLP-dependent enzyme [Bacteroidia bacterium]|nr:aminotransferase class V-fold PLP-dependent enzyme [Bacteroidia bacterium]